MKVARAGTSLLAILTLMLVPAVAHAQFQVFTNYAEFLAALSKPAIDTYDDLAVGDFMDGPRERTATGVVNYNYIATAPVGTFIVGDDSDRWLSTNEETDPLTLSFSFGSGVAGIGGFFFATALDGTIEPASQLVLTATNAGGSSAITFSGATSSTFYGLLSLNGDVTSLTVVASDAFPTVNDLVLGSAAPMVVPEPSTLMMLAAGAFGLAVSTRRRRTT